MRLILLFLFLACSMPLVANETLQEVNDLIASKKYEEAEVLLKTLEPSAKQLAFLAYSQKKQGNLAKSLLYNLESLQFDQPVEDLFDCYMNISWLYRRTGQFVEAQKFIEDAEKLLSELNTAIEEGESISKQERELFFLHFNYGLIYYNAGEYGDAIAQLKIALKNTYDQALQARCLNFLGRSAHLLDDIPTAINYYDSIQTLNYSGKYLARALHNKALLLQEIGEDPSDLFHRALELKKGNERFVTLQDYGTYRKDLKMLISALEYYPLNPDEEDFEIYRTIEHLYLDEGNLVQARKYDQLYHDEATRYIAMIQEAKLLSQQYNMTNVIAQYERNKNLNSVNSWLRSHIIWLVPSLVVFVGFALFVIIRTIRLRRRYVKIEEKYK
ncbi:MAG: tetratricopeptide repeat protein [Cytophagales bacterium]|nr:tetratricopeptide repeat protein [Cytophagales bacterium]